MIVKKKVVMVNYKRNDIIASILYSQHGYVGGVHVTTFCAIAHIELSM